MAEKLKDDTARWKTKYLDLLDQQEKDEVTWLASDDLLRRALIRVSLAADGLSSDLDRSLALLRKDIQKKSSLSSLKQRVDQISRLLLDVDEKKQQTIGLFNELKDQLVHPLRQIDWEGSQKFELNKLAKRKVSDNEQCFAFVQKVGELLSSVQLDIRVPGSAPMKKGLIQRLFSSEESDQDIDEVEDQVDPSDSSRATADDLAREILRLLENINLSIQPEDRIEELKEKISQKPPITTLLEMLDEIIVMISESIRSEHTNIAEFLQVISNSFDKVQKFIDSSRDNQQQSEDNGLNFDSAVRLNVDGIRSSIENADSVEHLQNIINLQLNSMLQQLDNYQAIEKERVSIYSQEIEVLNERLTEAQKESDQLKENLEEQRTRGLMDSLTQIANREAYDIKILAEYERWKRYGGHLSLIMADVDLFKAVNDTYGHLAGDKVLKVLAQMLRKGTRKLDFVARYGGEEFVIVMPQTPLKEAAAVGEKLRSKIAECPFRFKGTRVSVTFSMGVAEFGKSDSPLHVVERADACLYTAKEQGRNQVVVSNH